MKLRNSVIAKITAWMICIASIMGTVVLGICLAYGIFDGLLEQTREEALKSIYKYANMDYSREAFWNHGNSTYAENLRREYFKYGIIKSDSLAEVDFHDRLSYLDTNMTDEELANIVSDQLFLYLLVEKANGSLTGMSMEYYGDYEDMASLAVESDALIKDSEWTYLYADRICYDVAKGIVYYRAEGNYYPVQNVSLCYDGSEGKKVYNYNYDFNNQGYMLNYQSMDTSLFDNYTEEFLDDIKQLQEVAGEEAEITQPDQTDRIEEILGGKGSGSIVNLAELNNTTFSYSKWGTILLDNIRSITGEELMLIDSSNIADGFFIKEAGYYLNENYTLVVRDDIRAEAYWVVSLIPDYVPADRLDSKYNQESWYVNYYYDIVDRNLFQGLGISIVVMVLSFGFLVYAAGHRKAVDGIVLTPFDKIPIDILSVFVCGVEMGAALLAIGILEETDIGRFAYTSLGMCGLFGIFMTVIAVAYILSLCVRVKAGKWWRNSICYWIYSWIRDIAVNIFRNIHMLWKIVVIMGVILFVEIFVIINCYSDVSALFLLLEKLILCIILCVLAMQIYELQKASQRMAEGNLSYKIKTDKMFWECKKHGEYLNKISDGMSKAVDARMKSERLKTELITNVSHDIKTPLTSIINYVDLLSKEELHNDKAAEYLEVLERQSSKLKKLIEDLVEASKASSGNLTVDSQPLDVGVFVTQTVGEFEEKLSIAGLELIVSKLEESVYIMADGRHIWRVVDNLMNNICKYAQKGSRVYVNLEATDKSVSIIFRNISKYPLNISGEELMERFVRGDKSRNTEGHGLGLSIAQSLMKLIDGDMNIVVDGDLFKVVLTFDRYQPKMQELILEKEEEGDQKEKENADFGLQGEGTAMRH
ncbi:MAG: HAMP domain-containing histidine kinase [Lachnospiraceae bacterium]|nr:HAMP domain-containing histidine kinase [Lachnospiraceae bacterium]